MFRTSNKIKPSLEKSINYSYQKRKIDATFSEKNTTEMNNSNLKDTGKIMSKKLNFPRPNSLITKPLNNDSIYLQYSKLNDSLIKTQYEKKHNCSKILEGQSYSVENSSLFFSRGKDLSNASISGLTSANHSKNIISLKNKACSINKNYNGKFTLK